MKNRILLIALIAFISTGSSSIAVHTSISPGIYFSKDGGKHKCDEKCEKDCKEAAKCNKKRKRKCSKSTNKKGCCIKSAKPKKSCCAKKSSSAKVPCGSKSAKPANETQEK